MRNRSIYIYLALCLLPLCGYGQANTGLFSLNQTATGTLNIPPLQDLKVTTLDSRSINFEGEKDFKNGKHVASHYQLKILSNIPWAVTVKASDPMLTPLTSTTARDVPVSIVKLKPSNDNKYINLSTAPQTILVSDNNNLENIYYIDMKFDPTWHFPGGSYNIPLEFTLSPQ